MTPVITKSDAVRAILAHLGLGADAPRANPPRARSLRSLPDVGADD